MQRGQLCWLISSEEFIDKVEENNLNCQHAKGSSYEP
jgi:hypothetical protein